MLAQQRMVLQKKCVLLKTSIFDNISFELKSCILDQRKAKKVMESE